MYWEYCHIKSLTKITSSFRHFLLNTTNQEQLVAFINQTANNLLMPFPAGLSTPLGAIVANPAYGGDAVYAQNFTNSAYHGVRYSTFLHCIDSYLNWLVSKTVVWSWQLAMMVRSFHSFADRLRRRDSIGLCKYRRQIPPTIRKFPQNSIYKTDPILNRLLAWSASFCAAMKHSN